jgi:hypothetical protein
LGTASQSHRQFERYVEQRQPILDGLQREADKDQANSEDAHALLGHMIRNPFDEGRAGARDRRDHSNRQSGLQPDAQRVRALMRHQALIYPAAA